MSLLVDCCASALDLSADEFKARVDPVIFALLDEWRLDDGVIDRAIELGMTAIDTAADTAWSLDRSERRMWAVRNWIVRVCAPVWIDLLGAGERAAGLRDGPRMTVDFSEREKDDLVSDLTLFTKREWESSEKVADKALEGSSALVFLPPRTLGLPVRTPTWFPGENFVATAMVAVSRRIVASMANELRDRSMDERRGLVAARLRGEFRPVMDELSRSMLDLLRELIETV